MRFRRIEESETRTYMYNSKEDYIVCIVTTAYMGGGGGGGVCLGFAPTALERLLAGEDLFCGSFL